MSNYTKSTNFATKDNLSPGNPLKIVKGTEIDTEFNNIATAVATKTDNASAAITGGTITGITDLAVADGGTGASTAAGGLNNLLPSQTSNANKYLQTDGTNATWDAVSLSTADITGTLPVANGGTGVTSSTGTGDVVLSNSPTLVAPALGTPASGTATNLTGLPISTGVSGLGTGVATFLGTPSSANLASAVTDETGSGALVFANSPTLVTPALGTPASATLTNATGLPISTGVSGLGTGVASFLATPSSANLATAVSDETGSGALVFANSPTLVTPALGTPSSGTLTNATGLPISTGVSGLGTGVATALAVNVGSSGAPLVNGGVLGTPSSGTATNLTGLPLSTGVTGQLPVANGGTGTATPSIVAGTNVTVTGTWPNQTIASSGNSGTVTSVDVSGGTTGLTTSGGPVTSSGTVTLAGTLAVANGGTGQTSYTNGQLLIGNTTGNTLTKTTLTAGSGVTITNGTGSITIAASGGSGDVVGPASSTANGIALFDGTTGKLLKDSSATDGLIHGLTVGRGAGGVDGNTALGVSAFASNTTGANGTAVGYEAGFSTSTSNANTLLGYQAGRLTTGISSTLVGASAGGQITTGAKNTIIGRYNGNENGLDIRTSSNYIVLSDGDANILISTANSQTLALKGAFPNSGTGITFPASQSASSDANTLDDYEEGTWTPTVGGNATYDIQAGTYTKIGRLINIRFQLRITSLGTGSTTFMTGLPYNATTGGQGVVSYATGVASNFYSIVSHIDNSTQIAFNTTNSLGSGINYQATVFATSTYVLGNALYI